MSGMCKIIKLESIVDNTTIAIRKIGRHLFKIYSKGEIPPPPRMSRRPGGKLKYALHPVQRLWTIAENEKNIGDYKNEYYGK